jgi:hypothetical protein
MAPILSEPGPWTWGVRDCAFYPDYLHCRPHAGLQLCVYEVKPPGGPWYRCHVEILPPATDRRDAVEPVLLRLLATLPARRLVEIAGGPWPFD